jgi:hypothetical protein
MLPGALVGAPLTIGGGTVRALVTDPAPANSPGADGIGVESSMKSGYGRARAARYRQVGTRWLLTLAREVARMAV